jgi:uncharacterized protein YndB with AHSA1/START domain
MNNQLIASVSIEIDANASSVWAALTQPAWIKKYFFGTNAISDWKVGSPLIFKGEWKGKSYEDKGIILVNEPNRLLRYTYWSELSGTEDRPENYANITYELSEQNGKTTLTVTQDNVSSEKAKASSQENWQTVLKLMKALLENHEVKV